MKTTFRFLVLTTLIFSIVAAPLDTTQGQILRKLKQKAEEALEKAVGLDDEEEPTQTDNQNTQGYKKGKKLTPPDVNSHIDQAMSAATAENFSDVKFNIKQAITGVELEIGYAILDNAPTSVNGMDYVPEQDQVTSSGIGFVGLAIGRQYESKKQALSFGVMNNSALIAAYSGMLTNANYADQEGEQKQVSLDGNQGVLRYVDGDYELGVPLGQNSILLLEFEGFEDENEVMTVAREFKPNAIKDLLGEQ